MSALTNRKPSPSPERKPVVSPKGKNRSVKHSTAAKSDGRAFDFKRLESAVRDLVEEQGRLYAENASLRERLAAKEQETQGLDQELAGIRARRSDALKRLGDLLSRIDEMEARIARG